MRAQDLNKRKAKRQRPVQVYYHVLGGRDNVKHSAEGKELKQQTSRGFREVSLYHAVPSKVFCSKMAAGFLSPPILVTLMLVTLVVVRTGLALPWG